MAPEKDDIEKFFEEHGDEFPQYEPSADLWSKIKPQVEAKEEEPKVVPIAPKEEKVIKVATLYRAAAVLVIGLLAGYGIWGVNWSGKTGQTTVAVSNDSTSGATINNYYISLEDLSPDLAEVEQFYTSQIEEKRGELEALHVNQSYYEELEELDHEMTILQREASVNLDNERVVEAMVQNYRLRLELLENLLQEIQKEQENRTGSGLSNPTANETDNDVQS